MPVACSSSALTGQEGAIYFSPAGTKWCLKDFTDFPSGTDVKVPTNADYRVNDPIKFAVYGVATLDSALTAGTTYYVTTIGSGTIKVSASLGGTAITLNGNGGTGSADKLIPSSNCFQSQTCFPTQRILPMSLKASSSSSLTSRGS